MISDIVEPTFDTFVVRCAGLVYPKLVIILVLLAYYFPILSIRTSGRKMGFDFRTSQSCFKCIVSRDFQSCGIELARDTLCIQGYYLFILLGN